MCASNAHPIRTCSSPGVSRTSECFAPSSSGTNSQRSRLEYRIGKAPSMAPHTSNQAVTQVTVRPDTAR